MKAITTIESITTEEIKKKLDPTEYLVACNPVVSDGFKDAIKQGCIEPDLANFGSRAYYTDSLAEQLVHEPESFGLENLDLSDDVIKDILMLEKAYNMVMFIDL